MNTSTASRATANATRTRIRVVSAVLTVTAVLTVPGGLLWPETSTGNETYAYGDIEPIRQLWWGVLLGLGVVASLTVTAQAVATLVLVRHRGSMWATWGAALMWAGIAVQSVGAGLLAGAYYFPTSSEIPHADGVVVFQAIAEDQLHLFGPLAIGGLIVMVGTVLQAVGLFRSRTVPRWIPAATLFTLVTFVVPGDGVAGLITSLPMAAGAIGLAVHVWRRA